MTFRSRALLDLARDKACVMCKTNDGTIVAAHSNLLEHGKGAGHKAHDAMHAWLCYRCHAEYDQGHTMTKAEKREFILTAISRTVMQLWDKELIGVKK